MSSETLPEAVTEEVTDTARTILGGKLRSITYFTDDVVEQLYLRDYLEADADLESFADAERPGLQDHMDYQNTELGAFEFTIRVFDRGYMIRAIADGHGLFVTTDATDLETFEEAGNALQDVLAEYAGS